MDRKPPVLPVGRLRTGDVILVDDVTYVVIKVQRSPGRKPAAGENLIVKLDGGDLRANSLDGVRLVKRADD